MQIVILAGGKGTRLASVSGDLPKALVDVAGKTLLERQLEMVAAQGVTDVLILTGHMGDQIQAFCGDGARWGLNIRCSQEEAPRGTAGALLDAGADLAERFTVLYGDTVMEVDLNRLAKAHGDHGAAATLFLHPNDHPYDSDLVEIDTESWVSAFHPSPHAPDAELPNLVNAALYVLERDAVLNLSELPPKPDFGKHVFPAMLRQRLPIFGYVSPEYIKDAGTPDRIEKVRQHIQLGRLADRSLRTPSAAIFMDRDGVLNIERSRISRSQDLQLTPGAAEAVKRINDSRYLGVVVTNQPVIARGDCDVAGLGRIHARLDTLLGRHRAYIDALYFCPHHPDSGFAGERPELKFACACRKPETGLVDQAASDLNIDLARSWMIGDSTSDIEMARRAGLRSVLVRTGLAGGDGRNEVQPDHVAEDLAAAVDLILKEAADGSLAAGEMMA